MKTNFLGGAYSAHSKTMACNRLLNMYPEMIPEGGKEPGALIGCPGFQSLYYLGATVSLRGGFASSDGNLYVVADNLLYQITPKFLTISVVGTLDSGSGLVSMADNGVQLGIVDGITGYTYTYATATFAKITDPDFPHGCEQLGYGDTYGIAIDPGTQQFFISSSNDFTAWSALDFTSAEGSPDKALSIIVDHRELWVGGRDSTEVFQNTGNADFPYERVSGGFIEQGVGAVHSVVKMDNSVFWLGGGKNGSGIVWRAEGYQPTRVSNHGVERAISQYSRIDDAYAFAYEQEGHSFYVLIFPSGPGCWVYDPATKLWHERSGFKDGVETLYPITFHVHFEGKNVVGHRDNGRVYILDLDNHSYGTEDRKVLRSFRLAHNEADPYSIGEVVVDMEPGVGNSLPPGDDPMLTLRVSKDGGKSFKMMKRARMGKIGETNNRVVFRCLGQAVDWVLEVSTTDPVPVVMLGAYIT